jgi:hypothetical protein
LSEATNACGYPRISRWRRRWSEAGIKLWNPDFHGAGHAALNIQGHPGEKLPDMTRSNSKWFGPMSTGKRWTVSFAKVLLSIRQSAEPQLFDVAHESLVGTFETCRRTLRMSADRGRPEVKGRRSKRRF